MIPWKRSALLAALLVVPFSCARLRLGSPTASPHERLSRALVALDSGQYAPATQQLLEIASMYPDRAVGRQALLAAAAAELDPRNAERQMDQGAALLAQYLRRSGAADWTQPQAETMYLLSLELGAAADRAEQAEAEAARARAAQSLAAAKLPRLPGAPLTDRIDDLQRERDRLAARVKELETSNAGLQKQLADTVQELKRIRRTLRP